ncbi:hypothetical protein GCM10009846_29520 [Agrococcus versicolor]|uniref:Uncharacterized protein n=1 Tax=Agrococcus versicolor TaxID=501482 RepID=A0ABP5MTP0_9MICO
MARLVPGGVESGSGTGLAGSSCGTVGVGVGVAEGVGEGVSDATGEAAGVSTGAGDGVTTQPAIASVARSATGMTSSSRRGR